MQSINAVQLQQVTTGQSQTNLQKIVTSQPVQTFTIHKANSNQSFTNSNTKIVTLANNNQSQNTTILQPTSQGYSGQQFIVISGDPSSSDSMQEVEIQQGTPSQVIYQAGHNQYVDGHYSQQHGRSNFTPSAEVMQNYSEYNSVYPVGTYYHTTGSGQMAQLGGLQGQLVQSGSNTYLLPSGMDSDGLHTTHNTRASPATEQNQQRSSHFDAKSWQREIQWLLDNYETAEGVSLPRSTLYNHYLRHCQEQKIDPMNPASFGKLIRSVFLGLRTRRLGTRGNSKYHYYGIRLKIDSPLNAYLDDTPPPTRSQTAPPKRGNSKYHYYGIRIKPESPLNAYTDDHALPMRQQSMSAKRYKSVSSTGGDSKEGVIENSQQYQHQQFLGDASGAIPSFGCIEIKADQLPDHLSIENVRVFEDLFKKQCEQILGKIVNLQFSEVEKIWQTFWRTTPAELRQNSDILAEQRLSKEKLYALCRLTPVQDFIRRSDYSYYQALVEVLIPDVLRPIPSSLTQAVRNFAKSLESWLKNAMIGVPEDMLKTKVLAVSAFAQTLRRYTSLNHLAQAARAVLQNNTQISQMLADLNRVDFANVQEQASWVCQCEDSVVQKIQEDFKKTLQAQNSLENWALWLEGVVNQVLAPHEGGPNFAKAARQFLLKWSFYSSMVIRDLTLRSAASFGSFHLIRLLYDEYMFYLVEHKVAAATDESPIAVMGETRHQSLDGNFEEEPKVTLSFINSRPTSTVTAVTVSAAPTLAQVGLQGTPKLTHVTTLQGASKLASLGLQSGASPLTVVATASNSMPKTIVVVPVSSAGSGDAQPTIKRIKTN